MTKFTGRSRKPWPRLGGVMTTMLVHREQAVRELLGAPAHWALAAAIVLGRPVRQPRRLRRRAVSQFTTIDRVDGPALPDPDGT